MKEPANEMGERKVKKKDIIHSVKSVVGSHWMKNACVLRSNTPTLNRIYADRLFSLLSIYGCVSSRRIAYNLIRFIWTSLNVH